MNIGLGIGIPFTRSSLWSNIFTPTALFMDGSTEGVWYDPSDIKLNWRRNLLTYSEQFDNGAWPQNNITISANAAVSPDGTTTADLIYPTTTGGDRRLLRQTDGALTNGLVYTQSIYVKSSGFQWVRLNAVDATSGSDDVWFDVVNGVVGTVGSDAVATQITSAGNGWFRISVTGTAGLNDYFLLALADANNSTSATANGTSGIYIWGAQLELGSTSTEYQRITDGIQDYLTYQPLPVLYRDAAGTIPVTAVEQPVGLMLDKSKQLVLGPELVTNGDFSSGSTGWTATTPGVTFTDGVLTLNRSVGNPDPTVVNAGLGEAGKTYLIEFSVVSITSATNNVGFRIGIGAINYFGTGLTVAGRKQIIITATSTGVITLYSGGVAPLTTVLDNISVRELPGNHAFNPSGNSANFPVLSARYNVLNNTEILATQSVTTRAAKYILSFWGTGSVALSGTYTGTLVGTGADNRVYVEFTATAGTLTLTVTGSVLKAQLEEL